MPLQLKAAASTKSKKGAITRPSLRPSPFARHPRAKPFSNPSKQPPSKHVDRDEDTDNNTAQDGRYHGPSLPDLGPTSYIADSTSITNVIQAIQYVRNTMFSALPESRTGMNSVRIAEVLNFRRSLPPIVSVAHVHMLLNAPTRVEKEIVQLVDQGRVRRLFIPGRGSSAAELGDCVVLVEDWEEMVRRSAGLEEALREKFLQVLRSDTKSSSVPAGLFTPEESSSLVRAGFLVSSSSLHKHTSINTSLPVIAWDEPSSPQPSSQDHSFRDSSMLLSIPNLGPYLRLLSAAHCQISLLLRKSPFNEAPLYLLRDRWDGSVESDSPHAVGKRVRGEATGVVLPGRTKKWKELFGMNFRWALEEALGAGIVEVFETGSVGPGVRRL